MHQQRAIKVKSVVCCIMLKSEVPQHRTTNNKQVFRCAHGSLIYHENKCVYLNSLDILKVCHIFQRKFAILREKKNEKKEGTKKAEKIKFPEKQQL